MCNPASGWAAVIVQMTYCSDVILDIEVEKETKIGSETEGITSVVTVSL